MKSPYARRQPDNWLKVSQGLLRKHLLSSEDLVRIVLQAWDSIFRSRIGRHGHRIGTDILPQPQMMGFLLHELIPIELEALHAGSWRRGLADSEKDAVCLVDDTMSFEIKTSSDRYGIFGNRSYAQEGSGKKKSHQGYFLAVNFEKFGPDLNRRPEVAMIRFGWLDPADWIAQKTATGQQARLTKEARAYKLLKLWSRE